ncbi:MAG: hypothetical protein ABIQ51_21930 [Mesorhizobium sp.]
MAGHVLAFTEAETNSVDTVTAFVAAWHETSKPKAGFALNAASYGMVTAGPSGNKAMWGAGYANDPVPMLAFAVKRLLDSLPESTKLVVNAHSQLMAYVGRNPLGFVHSKSFSGHAVFREIAAALDAKHWILRSMTKGPLTGALMDATVLANGDGRWAALKHKREHDWAPHSHPPVAIVKEGP